MESSSLVFDGVVFVNERPEISNLNIIKNLLNISIKPSELTSIVLRNFREDALVETEEYLKGKNLKFTLIFKRINEKFVSVYGFAHILEDIPIGDNIFDIFDEVGNVCIVLYQDDGKIIFANNAFYETLGYEKGSLRDKHICELIGDRHREVCYHHVSERLKGVKFNSVYHGVKVIPRAGIEKIFSVYGSTVIYNSKPAGILFGVDITQESNLKKLYMVLKDVNQTIIKIDDEDELFSKVCNILVDLGFVASVVAYVDENGQIKVKYFAGKGREFFDKVFATVDGISSHGRGTAGRAFRENRIVINSDTERDEDMSYWRDDLLRLGFYSNCAVPIVYDGRVKNILLVFSDKKNAFVNEYIELLRELKADIEFALRKIRYEKNLRLIGRVLGEIEECVIITDANCKIEYVNSAFVKIFGADLEEVRGKTPLFFTVDKDTNCKDTRIYDELIKNGSIEFEYRFITKDKDIKTFDVSIGVVYKDGNIANFVGLMRDITLQRKHQLELAQLNRFYLALYHINEIFINSEDENYILKESCKIMVEDLNATASFVVVVKSSELWDITHAAVENDKMETFVKELRKELKGIDNSDYPFARSYFTNSIKIIAEFDRDKRALKFRDAVKIYGLKSCFAIPLQAYSNVFGVLVAVFNRKVEFSKRFYRLLLQIRDDVRASITNLRSRRWNRIISIALNAGFSYVIIMDEFFRIIYMNEAALEFHGYTYEEVVGKRHSIFSSNQHDKEFLRRMAKTLKSGKAFSDLFIYRTKDGRLVEGYTTIIPYKEDGKIKYYIAVGKDMTKEKELQKRLMFLSSHDLLTKLPNKDEFIRKVNLVLRKNKDSLFAFAIIDIHNCSYINQVYGYRMGDDLIKETAKRLTESSSKNDIVGRLSGDKFVMFMSSVQSEEDALVKLMGIIKKLNKPINFNGFSLSVSYHIGVSFYPIDGELADDLIAKAELALISAKTKGENEVGFFKKKTQEKIIKIIQLKDKLKNAYDNNEFVLFYQPYYSIENGNIAGAEALLRWIHEGRVVPPSDFIEVLEESDLMFDVEERIIQQAVETISSIRNKVPISVNISPRSFKRDFFVSLVKDALEERDIPGKYLTVEVVERVFIDDKDYTKSVMRQLKNLGVRIAVDDFGTGFSSLTYIRELPLDILKIDITFVKGMMKNEKDLSLVRLIIGIAKEFGLKTVAEGIETKEQLDLLKNMGCDYAQGYLLSRPIDKDSFINMLK